MKHAKTRRIAPLTFLLFACLTAFFLRTADRAPLAWDTPIAVEDAEWCLILVNRWNCVPEGYEPELIALSNGELVDRRIYPALQELFDAARSDGVFPVVTSGYRTVELQQQLMDNKIAAYLLEGYTADAAAAEAELWIALPGTSEHQLGLAVDVSADRFRSDNDAVYDWFRQNAHRFGFICRYPAGKTALTGIAEEPWHYRYVGREAAEEMNRQNLCLEEYLSQSD